MKLIRLIGVAVLAVGLAGCDSAPIKGMKKQFGSLFQSNKGETDLAAGIRSYDNGNYNESAGQLQSALDSGLGGPDQVRAHKYLAFIHCAAGRERQCRGEFRMAFDIDPSFQLSAAEAGHPTWGPVFRSVKAGR